MGRCQDPEWDDLLECDDLGAVIGYLGDTADARELLDAIEEQDADRALVVLRNMHGRFHDDWRRQGTPGGISGRGSVPDGVSTSGMAKLVRDDESGLFFLIPLGISAAKIANQVQRESRKDRRHGAPATAPAVAPAVAPAPATATVTTSRMVVLVPGSKPAASASAPKSKASASRAGVATAPPNVPPAPGVVVIVQGEADAQVLAKAQAYEAQLDLAVTRIHAYWPAAPIVVQELVTTAATYPYHEIVRDAQNAVAARYDYVGLSESEGLPTVADGVHLTPGAGGGYDQMAARITAVALGMLP